MEILLNIFRLILKLFTGGRDEPIIVETPEKNHKPADRPAPSPTMPPQPQPETPFPVEFKEDASEDHMTISADKKRIIQSILSVFETGKTEPDYGSVVVLDDGAGITYGKHQSTDGGESSLDKVVLRYIDLGGDLASQLSEYLPMLADDATTQATPGNIPLWVQDLMNLLVQAGKDPVMHRAQDEVFDEHYWAPAASQAEAMQLMYPLSWLVCYDSTIHSGVNGIARIRKRFPESPPSGGGDEKAWTKAYLQARRDWLASHSNPVVQNTVYRIDAMLDMVEADNWNLDTPIDIKKPRARVV